MDSRVRFINKVIKGHDSELFAKRVAERIIVYRNAYRWGKPYKIDTGFLRSLEFTPQFVLALTDDWQFNGKPRDWGWEPIRKRLKDMDWWENEQFLEELEAEEKAIEESKNKDVKNNIESFMYDQHSSIKKSWSDVNTANMTKK